MCDDDVRSQTDRQYFHVSFFYPAIIVAEESLKVPDLSDDQLGYLNLTTHSANFLADPLDMKVHWIVGEADVVGRWFLGGPVVPTRPSPPPAGEHPQTRKVLSTVVRVL